MKTHAKVMPIIAMALLASVARADVQTYKICLHRVSNVGQVFSIDASTQATRTIKSKTPGNTPPRTDKISFHLIGTQKVLAVEPNTHCACKAEVTVSQFTNDNDPVVPPGTVIIVENLGESRRCTIDGQPVEQETADALRPLVPLQAANDPHTNDEVMGTDRPQKVGDSWKADAAQLARRCTNPQYSVTEDDVKGTATLVAVESGDHGPLLHVKFTTEVKNLHGDWCNNQRFNAGTTTEESTSIFPEDPLNHRLKLEMRSTFNGEVSTRSAEGRTADFEMTSERKLTMTIAPVEK